MISDVFENQKWQIQDKLVTGPELVVGWLMWVLFFVQQLPVSVKFIFPLVFDPMVVF